MKRRTFLTQSAGLATGMLFSAFVGVSTRSFASTIQSHRILDLDWIDAKRNRPVPSRLYMPQHATASRAVPLVVFSHGLGGSRMGYQYLASHWADAGIASLNPQHVGSDNAVWRGNPLELVQRLQTAAREFEARSRALDLRFALDQILSSELGSLIDTTKIAVAGHSYGANTAMLVSGARAVTAGGDMVNLEDQRIRSAILISAPPLRDQGPIEKVLGAVKIPTLHVTSIEDTINLPGFRSTVADRIAIFHAMGESPRTLAVFNAGGHSIFTDRTTRSGPEISARVKGATRELSTIFLWESLIKEPQIAQSMHETSRDLDQWLERHKDLLNQFIMPDSLAAMRAKRQALSGNAQYFQNVP